MKLVGRVGPQFDPAQLQEMLAAHIADGGTIMEGAEAARILNYQNANGLYMAADGGPGTIVLFSDATRLEVTEEFMHLEQFRTRGWPTTNRAVYPTLREDIEVEAQQRLLEIAKINGWTQPEIDKILENQQIWQQKLQEMLGMQ